MRLHPTRDAERASNGLARQVSGYGYRRADSAGFAWWRSLSPFTAKQARRVLRCGWPQLGRSTRFLASSREDNRARDLGVQYHWTSTPGAGSRYYLVVSQSANREGSYGSDSDDVERPPGGSVCLVQAIAACP